MKQELVRPESKKSLNRKKNTSMEVKPEKLSERETEILQQMANGLSSRVIGDKLCISEDTVETHRKNIYRKISANNAAEAMAYGFRNKLIV